MRRHFCCPKSQALPIWTRWPKNTVTSRLGDDGNARGYAERRREAARIGNCQCIGNGAPNDLNKDLQTRVARTGCRL